MSALGFVGLAWVAGKELVFGVASERYVEKRITRFLQTCKLGAFILGPKAFLGNPFPLSREPAQEGMQQGAQVVFVGLAEHEPSLVACGVGEDEPI